MMAGSYAKRLKRKQRRQAERLEAILDAACALVTERPISRISTEGIARRATLPLGVVYNLFGSKEQVIRNLLLRTQDNLFDDLEALIMSVDDPAEQIHLMVSRYLEFFDRYSTPLRFYYNSTAAPGLEVRRETFSERYTRGRDFTRLLTRVCTQGQATGLFAADMPAELQAVAIHAVPHAFLFAMVESEGLVIADVLPHAHVCVDRILDLHGARIR